MGFCWKCEDNLALEIGFWSVGSVLNSFLIVCCREVTSVVPYSVPPHRRQLTRLCHPWDSPGKNTEMGCHFLLQCMKVKSESEVPQGSDSSGPHGLQPTRRLHPWDFPGKSTGVSCHFLLMKERNVLKLRMAPGPSSIRCIWGYSRHQVSHPRP